LPLWRKVRKIVHHSDPRPDILSTWHQLLSLPIPCHVHCLQSYCLSHVRTAAICRETCFRGPPLRHAGEYVLGRIITISSRHTVSHLSSEVKPSVCSVNRKPEKTGDSPHTNPPLACNTQQYAAQITLNTEHKYAPKFSHETTPLHPSWRQSPWPGTPDDAAVITTDVHIPLRLRTTHDQRQCRRGRSGRHVSHCVTEPPSSVRCHPLLIRPPTQTARVPQ